MNVTDPIRMPSVFSRIRVNDRWLPSWAVFALGFLGLAVTARSWDPALKHGDLLLLLTNLVPWLLAWLTIWAATRRGLLAAALVASMFSLFQIIQAAKIDNLQLPILPGDLAMVANVTSHFDLMVRFVQLGWEGGIAIALALLALFLVEPPSRWMVGKTRRIVLVVSTVALASLFMRTPVWRSLYDADDRDFSHWDQVKSAQALGGTYYLLYATYMIEPSLSGGDKGKLASFEDEYGAEVATRMARAPTGVLPDIVVIQSEAHFDPSRVNGVGDGYIANERRLAAMGLHGNMTAPTFGGLTTRTEFEFLTGIPLLQAYANVQHPYQAFRGKPLRSIISGLKAQGYSAHAIHPNVKSFYDRDDFYPDLGFDSFQGIGEFSEADLGGLYTADAKLFARIVGSLDDAEPSFVFAVTMQNHSPWNIGVGDESSLSSISVPDGLNPDEAQQLRRYLQRARHADQALGDLWVRLKERKRPVVLVFYGDHLPSLMPVFVKLGFKDGRSALEQPVPWFAVDTRGELGPQPIDLHAYELPALLFDRLGLRPERYFASLGVMIDKRLNGDPRPAVQYLPDVARTYPWEAKRVLNQPKAFTRVEGMVKLEGWGPSGMEAGDAVRDEGLSIWFKFAAPLTQNLALRFDGKDIQKFRQDDHTLTALLPPKLLREAGKFPIDIVDVRRKQVQRLAEFVVAPRAKRRLLANGAVARNLCDVADWGPRMISKSSPPSVLADGGFGLFVKAGCLPASAELELDGRTLATSQANTLVTASIPTASIKSPGFRVLRLRDKGTNESMEVGRIEVVE